LNNEKSFGQGKPMKKRIPYVFELTAGFGALFFFQCGGVRSSEWCVKNSLTLLFKRTLTHPLMQHQTCEYKTNDFYVQHIQVKHTVL
jgi:hypothetical protein